MSKHKPWRHQPLRRCKRVQHPSLKWACQQTLAELPIPVPFRSRAASARRRVGAPLSCQGASVLWGPLLYNTTHQCTKTSTESRSYSSHIDSTNRLSKCTGTSLRKVSSEGGWKEHLEPFATLKTASLHQRRKRRSGADGALGEALFGLARWRLVPLPQGLASTGAKPYKLCQASLHIDP